MCVCVCVWGGGGKLLLEDYLLALIGVLTLEAVEEAARVIALLVASLVPEQFPAGHLGRAVDPGALPVQGAVAPVPLAHVVIALGVAHVVAGLPLALRVGAASREARGVLAVGAGDVARAEAAVRERVGRVPDTGAPVLAWPVRAPLRQLAVLPVEARQAPALDLSAQGLAVAAVLAAQLGAIFHFTTVGPSVALRTRGVALKVVDIECTLLCVEEHMAGKVDAHIGVVQHEG